MANRPLHKRHESNPSNASDIPKKRIVICCDGTWQDADSANTPLSNVAQIGHAIPPIGRDETGKAIPQVVFYQNGIGTGSAGWYQEYIGSQISGATGSGLIFNIREAYAFLCSNYHSGDDVVLIGFSRGAFTARSLSALINELGLLTTKGLAYLVQIIDDWEYQLDPTRPRQKIDIWPERPQFTDARYKMELRMHQLTRANITIKAVAVWDTVGSLGVPATGISLWFYKWFSKLYNYIPDSLQKWFHREPKPKQFSFVNTEIADNIEYAFHALGLDEKRESFSPTIWHKPNQDQKLPIVLKQTWFAGVHSDIGGSYSNNDNSIITLAWMIGQLEQYDILTFNEQHIYRLMQRCVRDHLKEDKVWDMKIEHEHDQHPHPHPHPFAKLKRTSTFGALTPWGTGKIHDSYTGFMKLGGVVHRTPMEYENVSRDTKQNNRIIRQGRLTNTYERMHPSVRERLHMHDALHRISADIEHLALWKVRQHTLKGWKDTHVADDVWRYTKEIKEQGETVVLEMVEDELTEFEKKVKATWEMIDANEDLAKTNSENAEEATEEVLDFARVDEIGTEEDIKHDHIWKRQTFLQSDGKTQDFVEVGEFDEGTGYGGRNGRTVVTDFAAKHGQATMVTMMT